MHRFLTVSAFATALHLAAAATAQNAINPRTGTAYGTLAQAIAEAAAGDALELSGTFQESVLVDKDLTLTGLPGASLTAGTANLIEVAAAVNLTIDGLLLDGTGNTRGILAAGGDNELVVRNCTFSTGSALPGADGGGIHIVNPRLLHVQSTVFSGAGEVWGVRGGAVFATAAEQAPVVFEDVQFVRTRTTGQGGAIWGTNVAITCTRCTFEGTQGSFGGGIYAAFSTLRVEQSIFCGTHASLGGGIFSSADTEIRSTVFIEGTAVANGSALYGNGGAWSFVNNHVLGMGSPSAVFISSLSTVAAVTNNLFLSNSGAALSVPAAAPSATYNWFWNNTADANVALGATNFVGRQDPQLESWRRDGDCANDELWPRPIASPLIDAGDPAILDPDGSRSDIGAFAGEAGDPYYFTDHDGDGSAFFEDCDDTEPTVYPGAPEICDHLDNDCDGSTDIDPVDLDSFHMDCDGDGQGNPVASHIQCWPPLNPPPCGGVWLSWKVHGFRASSDCDDDDPDTYFGAPETCAPGDQNCDGHDDRGAVDAFIYYFDGDRDGYGSMPTPSCSPVPIPGLSALGGDCADSNPNFYPGAPDFCGDRLDQDCNGYDGADGEVLSWYPDADGDGFGDRSAAPIVSCVPGAGLGYVADDTDCDDGNRSIHPGAIEACDDLDNDCNGVVDNIGNPSTWYIDADGDGYGDPATAVAADCRPGSRFIATGGDCDDTHPLVNPAAIEICDDIDNDCNGVVDNTGNPSTWYADADGDGYGDSAAAVTADCSPGSSYIAIGGDCNDANAAIHPGAAETCDGIDDDCNGAIDDTGSRITWYSDADGDGFGDDATAAAAECSPGPGWIPIGGDCDDADATVFPGAPELCDGKVNACGGVLPASESDADSDGWAACAIDAGGWDGDPAVFGGGDCDDADAAIHPGAAEIVDGLDQDCDGIIDNALPPFRRGDCNDDGAIDLSDAICVLEWLFLGGTAPGCPAVANANGDVLVDISDPVYLLWYLFLGGPPPAAPFPDCGASLLDSDRALGCETQPVSCRR